MVYHDLIGEKAEMLLEAIALLLVTASPESQADASRRPARADNPDRVICRAPEGVTGSRLAQRRVCKSVAEWRAYDVARDQFRRELMNTPMPRTSGN